MLDFSDVMVLDRNAEYLGVPASTLMEAAGQAVAEAICDNFDVKGATVLIFCGRGNNGGDGFVAARHLSQLADVRVLLAQPPEAIKSELSRGNYALVKSLCRVVGGTDDVAREVERSSIVVDAMLGVGVRGNIREPYASIINLINTSGKKVLSVDVASGLGCDVAVRPDITVTFHDRKTGMTEANSGRIVVADIGIPPEAEQHTGPGDLLYYPRPKPTAHKGENGRLLVVGGGPYTGAPALAALGAQRMGVDLVHITVPRPISHVVAGFSPNFIVYPLGTAKEGRLLPSHIDSIMGVAEMCDAAVVGPGCGTNPETLNSIVELVSRLNMPMVLDADALTAVSRDLSRIKGKKVVLTPHPGEFQGAFQTELPEPLEERRAVVKKFAGSLDCTIVLKGNVDIISDGGGIKENHTGNPGMTAGGTGDVLAGAIGGMLAKGVRPYHAARLATFVVGEAGDLAMDEMSYGFTATDLVDMVPRVLRRHL